MYGKLQESGQFSCTCRVQSVQNNFIKEDKCKNIIYMYFNKKKFWFCNTASLTWRACLRNVLFSCMAHSMHSLHSSTLDKLCKIILFQHHLLMPFVQIDVFLWMLNNHALLLKRYEKQLLSLLFTEGVLIEACNPNLKVIMHVWHIQVCSQCSFWLPVHWMDFKELILLSLVTRNLIKRVLTFYHKKVMQTTAPMNRASDISRGRRPAKFRYFREISRNSQKNAKYHEIRQKYFQIHVGKTCYA